MRAGEVIGLFRAAQEPPVADNFTADNHTEAEPAPHVAEDSAVVPVTQPRPRGVIQLVTLVPRVWLVAGAALLVVIVIGFSWSQKKSRVFPESALPVSARARFRPIVTEATSAPRSEKPSQSDSK
jgi:hypothetical protein